MEGLSGDRCESFGGGGLSLRGRRQLPGYRIVGTVPEFFTEHRMEGNPIFELPGDGRVFDPNLREAVIGSVVAHKTKLRIGSRFQPTHSLDAGSDHVHDEDYVVVGILAPTNSPADKVIWIPIEGMFRMDGHYLRGAGENFEAHAGEAIPDEHKEVSAVMLRLKDPAAGFMMQARYNKEGKEATLAWPIATEVQSIFQQISWVSRVLILVAYLVVVVAAGSLLASLYNTMNERRREFAILRSLGARRRTLLGVILLESGTIALGGALLGFVVYFGIMAGAAAVIRSETGVVLRTMVYHPAMLWTPLGMLVVGAIAGLVPAMKAYSTDVSRELSQSAA
ncbi:MAG: ABC transporter permease [Planctomycetota bacterium]